jgi:hypothetical protein
VFHLGLHAYDQLANSTDFASVRLVVTKDKDWPAQKHRPAARPALQGEVVDDKAALRVAFTPAAPLTGFVDTYEVFTKVGQPSAIRSRSPSTAARSPHSSTASIRSPPSPTSPSDAAMRTYTVNNTHQLASDPAFTTARPRLPQAGRGRARRLHLVRRLPDALRVRRRLRAPARAAPHRRPRARATRARRSAHRCWCIARTVTK